MRVARAGNIDGSSPTSSSISATRPRVRAASRAVEGARRPDVVRDRPVREEPDLLDHVADAAPWSSTGVRVEDVRPVDPDLADVGSMSLLIIRIVVVLPQPDGLDEAAIRPRGTSKDSSWTATVPSGYW